MKRRDFFKVFSLVVFNFLLKKDIFAISDNLEQRVKINLPAYSLTLIDYINGNLEKTYTFPVGIGKGSRGRKQTPTGTGFINEKRQRVIFRYGKSYPHLNINEGDIIKWTNTYDKYGNPKGYHMPYSQIRGLGMKIKAGSSDYYYNDFVIHSTTDEFTIGAPTSNGCLRVGMQDMLDLYDIVAPEVKKGMLNKPIPIKILYGLITRDQETITLHANVYKKKINLIKEFKKKLQATGFNQEDFDYNKIEKTFLLANKEFTITHKKILNILSKSHPRNFVPLYLRKRLHKTYEIASFLRS